MKFVVKRREGRHAGLAARIKAFIGKSGAEWTGEAAEDADFAIIIGGDGTLLRYNSQLKCPILGVNAGHSVGHYMRACADDFPEKLSRLIRGREGKDYHVYRLARLEARVNGRKMAATALNDVLVSPIYVRRALKAVLKAGGRKTSETSSGIIVYTPTGSTAFAHSAGAKKVAYDRDVMGVAALAPHMGRLKRGEMLLGGGTVSIECLSEEGEVSIDGSEENLMRLKKGDTVTVTKSRSPLRLVGFRKRFG